MQVNKSKSTWSGRKLRRTADYLRLNGQMIVGGLILILLSITGGCSAVREILEPLPSDSKMEAHFRQHEGSFKELASILNRDDELRTVVKDPASGIKVIPELLPGKTDGKPIPFLKTHLENLLDDAEVNHVYKAPGSGGAATLFMSFRSRYLGTDIDGGGVSEEKGYAFSTSDLSPLAPSLDLTSAEGEIRFKRLSSSWYLYSRISVSKPE